MRMLLKSLAFAIRMVLVGLLTAGFINHVHAQTAPKEKQEAAEKEKQEGAAGGVTTLPEMKISAERPDELPQPYAGGQVARGGRLGVLGNTDLMKAPFSISSYTSQMMLNQHAITAADLLTRDPSVRSTGQRGGVVDSFYIRGFPIGEGNVGEFAFDGQYDVPPTTGYLPNTPNVSRCSRGLLRCCMEYRRTVVLAASSISFRSVPRPT